MQRAEGGCRNWRADVLVFLFYLFIGIVILLGLIITILALSSIKIQILELEATNTGVKYKIAISLFFLGIIKYFKIKIDENFNKKINPNKVMKFIKPPQINWKEQLKTLKLDFIKLHIKLEEFHMKLSVGTSDVLVTTAIIVIISTMFPVLFRKAIKKYDSKKYFYTITPVYANKNILKLTLNSIINIKLVHIIYVIILLMKGSGVKNERASDRRINDDGYGQYSRYDRCQHNHR